MAKLDEKNVASVKKTVSVAGPTGGILAQMSKLTPTGIVREGGQSNEPYAPMVLTAAGRRDYLKQQAAKGKPAAAVKGQGGQTMGGKATAAKGKGGTTMGQKAAVAKGQGGPVVQAIKNKLTGKPANAASAPAEKQEQLKLSTFNLPTVVRVGNQGYDPNEVFGVAKKIEQTYGRDSEEFKQFAAGVGLAPTANKGWGFPGIDVRKPDLRKDTKSYVDTAQKEYGISTNPMYAKQNYRGFGGQNKNQDPNSVGRMIKYAADMLEEFGAKPGKRLLSQDEKGYQKGVWGGISGYYE
jgi:hypothetical protein